MTRSSPAFLRLAGHPVRWRLLSALAGSDLRVRELVRLVEEPQNLVSYHLRLLRDGGLVTATRSTMDARDSYYHLDLDRCGLGLADTGGALHPALRHRPVDDSSGPFPHVAVLFACTGNSARSPIAEALLRAATGGQVEVASAGSRPRPETHAEAVRVLRDDYDLDIAGRRPRHLDTVTARRFDLVVTLCDKAREACPEFAGHPRRIHWSIAEPTTPEAFASTARDIHVRVNHLVSVLKSLREGQSP
ncbi:ArsR family transcriptional regulator [Asanoa sp. NPDC049518]|uniref:arsenate reductase/protein-tyrosine-phosphatase family protein n=1 Tax=unclassified Asanoa TaxID=2685164 RepID=UPI0034321C8B